MGGYPYPEARMEVDRVRKVADMIEAHPEHFDMESVVSSVELYASDPTAHVVRVVAADLTKCGTTACIAGWACNLWPADIEPEDAWESAGARILGLGEREARRLFEDYGLTTADKAAAHLRGMADDYEAAGA